MAVLSDRQALRARLRDHARWIIVVMVAGLLPLGLGAALLIHASDQSARRYQGARLNATAAGEAQLLANYFSRQRAIILVSASSPVWRDVFRTPEPLEKTIASHTRPAREVDAATSVAQDRRRRVGQRGLLHRAERARGGTTRARRRRPLHGARPR
jgi:hypothetical protein